MTHPDPLGVSGDGTFGGGHRQHRARHSGVAPEPYVRTVDEETFGFDQPTRTSGVRRSRAERRPRDGAGRRTGPPPVDPPSPADQPARAEQWPDGGLYPDGGLHPDGGLYPGGGLPPDTGRPPDGGDGPGGVPPRDKAPVSAPVMGDPRVAGGRGTRRKGRAGRNLPAAIGVGVGLGAAVIGSLLVWLPAFLVLIMAAVIVATWEMVRALGVGGAQPPLVPLAAGGTVMAGLAWFGGPDALAVGLLATVLAAMVWRLGDGPVGFQRDLTAVALIAVYVPFLGGFAALLAVADRGALWVLATLAAVVLSDTGGYVAGVSFGRHPMAPRVSPKKSWEGMAGSLLASGLGSALLLRLTLDTPWWWGAVFGLVLSVAATLGDLAESMIKRDLGIKDMSQLLPGHGGLMDRLDSILFALPTAYMLMILMPQAGG